MKISKERPRRILVVADIHGQIKALEEALKSAKFNPKNGDYLIMLGDLIDRGYGSKEALDFAMELVKQGNGLVLRGNHEQMAIDAYESGYFQHWFSNGGLVAHQQILGDKKYLDFMKSLPLIHFHDSFIFVHAGLDPNAPIIEQDPEDLLWIREEFIVNEISTESTIIVGHTPVQYIIEGSSLPISYRNKIFMDTGAALGSNGGKVTVYDIHSEEYWQADCMTYYNNLRRA